MQNNTLVPSPKSLLRSFTLIELIVVIIIVGILAAVGLTQYSTIVEKGRIAEAKVRIGAIRQLAYEYYLNNNSFAGLKNVDVGLDNTCSSTDFYKYGIGEVGYMVYIVADRCTSGGKTPNTTREYKYVLDYYAGSSPAVSIWHCVWIDTGSGCFGLDPNY